VPVAEWRPDSDPSASREDANIWAGMARKAD